MRNILFTILFFSLLLSACSMQESTNYTVYKDVWNKTPISVTQIDDGEEGLVNELVSAGEVKQLINELKSIKWKENVDVDIRPADYQFTYNGFQHHMWVEENGKQVSMLVEGRSNYTVFSPNISNKVFESLIGKPLH